MEFFIHDLMPEYTAFQLHYININDLGLNQSCILTACFFLIQSNVDILEWPFQSPDLNLRENLRDPIIRVMASRPFNLKDLEFITKDTFSGGTLQR